MTTPRVLVMEKHGFERNILGRMLRQLGIHDVLQAEDAEQAMIAMQRSGGVDIVLCDLGGKGLDCLELLRYASPIGLVKAVALFSEHQPELRRAVGQMASLSGLQLLGVLDVPLQLGVLSRLLKRYRCPPPPLLQALAVTELPSEEEVRRGLAMGEFRGWFQPKRVMRDGRLAGAEALVRWEHPEKGLLLPKDFLAAVLAYDLIDEMFKQLFEQGLNILGILRRQGIALEMAFNLHASQLSSPSLIEHIQRTLQRHGICGSALMFELAENGLLDLHTQVQENLLHMRMLGCGLSIDDFGSGFSSLKLLCQLPFNQIKLDGQFVHNLSEPRNRAMVASTLALARSLDMTLVIEGVSSRQIRDALVAMGCQIGQGFYLARPMSGHDLLQWLHQAAFEAQNVPSD
ncbi:MULTISPECIES: EAL domain-containing protein [unclassified Pseudomonas]|uniref:EAL domain-containing response regulator n=1 Tax=unclassified Pseudomonas TaxID=196821 RepID=UPI001FFE56E5|nr:EAL domain-containing protein [Pseudomonas sp. MWU12-2020]